jgi:SOS-response transcriptional repressor LexA
MEFSDHFTDRLQIALAQAGGIPHVAQELGIGQSTLYNYRKGAQSPSVAFIYQLARLAGIEPGWIVGTQELSKEQVKVAPVPLYDISISAGGGAVSWAEEVQEHLSFNESWLRENFGEPENLVLFRIVGDSQEPLMSTDDTLMTDRSKRTPGDGLHVVRTGDTLQIKRLHRISASKLQLLSANPAYPPIEIDLEAEGEQFEIVGKGVCLLRMLI